MDITGLKVDVKHGERISDFLEMMQGYEFGLLYYFSEVSLTPLNGRPVQNPDQLIEARLFSHDRELHLFQTETGACAVLVLETEQAEYLDEWRPLSRTFQEAGKLLGVRKYAAYDPDGQVYVALTRLSGVKGGE